MKKMVLLCTAALATTMLVAAPNAHQSISAGSIAMAASRDQFSNAEYAVMGFLQFSKQQVKAVQDSSLQLAKNGSAYTLTDDNNQFSITVTRKKVTVKTTDQNNTEKQHVYTKSQLRKKFKGQAAAIKAKINDQAGQAAAAAPVQQNSQLNGNQQQASQAAAGSASDNTNQGNNNGQSGMISENEWYERLIAAGWDENGQTADYYTHKAGLDGVLVAPQ